MNKEIFDFNLESKLKKEFALKYNCKLDVGIFENYLKLEKNKERVMLIHQFSKKRTKWENSFKLLDEYILAELKKVSVPNIIFKRLYSLDLNKKTNYYLEIKIDKKGIICTELSGKKIHLDFDLNKIK